MNTVHYSSKTDQWATPWELFNKLNDEFNFTLDAAADATNRKVERYFSEQDNGLEQDWSGERVWLNPPYGREIKLWVEKAYKSALAGATVVMLIPARPDTSYWHDFIFPYAKDVRFLRGRVKFGAARTGAPFPSAVVVF